jgi:hypothetical protein
MGWTPRLALLASALALESGARGDEPPEPPTPPAPPAAKEPAHPHLMRRLLDVLETVDTAVYTRNSAELKYEWNEKQAGAAMAEITFKPVFVFGEKQEFALRIEAPIETLYPGNVDAPVVSGFATLTTTLFWAFYAHKGIRQVAGVELQWNTATRSAVGGPWVIEPIYAVAFHLVEWLSLNVELNWQKSFGDLGGYNPVNLIQTKVTLSAVLPDQFFVAAQSKTNFNFVKENVASWIKLYAGRFLTPERNILVSVVYQRAVTPAAEASSIQMMGVMGSYFFHF